jgi:NitT/TauT family transport system permease protein
VKNFTINNKIKKIFVIFFWIAVWEAAAVLINQPLYLPSLSETLSALYRIIFYMDFWKNVGATFLRVLVGLLISFIFGIVLGIISAKSDFIALLFSPFLSTMKAIPTMSIIILALVWLKTGLVPVFVCFILCFPIIYTNTLNGIKSIDTKLIELCDIYKIKRNQRISDVIIPSVKPHILSAVMVCVGLSWKSTIAAEVLSAPALSMGYQLYTTKIYLDIPELFAWTIVVVFFSMLIEKLIKGFITTSPKSS